MERYWGGTLCGLIALLAFIASWRVNVEEGPTVRHEPQTVTVELGLPAGSEALLAGHTLFKATTALLNYDEWKRRAVAGEFSRVYYELGRQFMELKDSPWGVHVYGSRRDTPVLEHAFRPINWTAPENHRVAKQGIEGANYVVHTEYDPEARYELRNELRDVAGGLGCITGGFLLFYIIRAMHESKKRAKS